mgnify:CR=1 FL=1
MNLTALSAGLGAMIAQLLIIRELMVISLGDELSMGLVFFAWLIWTGIGGAAGGAATRNRTLTDNTTGLLVIALGSIIPLSMLFARVQGVLFGYIQGELVPVEHVLAMSLISLAPVCLLTGFLFPVLARAASRPGIKSAAGGIYAWDTLGAVIGGLAFSLVLAGRAGQTGCAFAAAVIVVFTGSVWIQRPARSAVWLLLVIGAATAPIWLGSAGVITRTLAWGTPPARSVESPYGNITVLRDEKQASFFASGRFAGAAPDIVFGEYMAHVPLLAHPAPRSALFIGAGATTLREALKHGLDRVAQIELDPEMIRLHRQFSPPDIAAVYDDPRVEIITGDPLKILSGLTAAFDVIVVDSPPPETLLLNRYFTTRAFSAFALGLKPGGLLAVTIPFSENYMGDAQSAMLGSIINSACPGDTGLPSFVIGAKPLMLLDRNCHPIQPFDAAGRFRERGIASAHFGPDTAAYLFDPARVENSFMQFSSNPLDYVTAPDKIWLAVNSLKNKKGAVMNTDMYPANILLGIKFASSHYRSSAAPELLSLAESAVNRIRGPHAWIWIIGVIAISLLAGFASSKRQGEQSASALLCAAIVGFAGMGTQLMILFLWQIRFGIVYQQIGLLTAAFMAGTAAGAWLASINVNKNSKTLSPALPATVLGAAAFLGVQSSGFNISILFIPLTAIICGACVGAVFPLCLGRLKTGSDAESLHAGRLYFADLAGAAAGALLTGTLLLPLLGFPGAAALLLLACSCAACLTAFRQLR